MTIHEIIQSIKYISENIVGISSFTLGDKFIDSSPNMLNESFFPTVQMEMPISFSNNPQSGRPVESQSYTIYLNVLDQPIGAKEDQIFERSKILGKTQQLADTVLEVMKQQYKSMNTSVVHNSSLTIVDDYNDVLTGIRMELTITTPKNINICESNFANSSDVKNYLQNPREC